MQFAAKQLQPLGNRRSVETGSYFISLDAYCIVVVVVVVVVVVDVVVEGRAKQKLLPWRGKRSCWDCPQNLLDIDKWSRACRQECCQVGVM